MLSGLDLLITIPLNIYAFSTWFPISPWPGWAAVHSNFSHVERITAVEWRSDAGLLAAVEATRWTSVLYALLFFMFFGVGAEARKHYTSALKCVGKRFGYYLQTPSSWVKYVFLLHLLFPQTS
jgi:pheromone a factor receptor